VACSASLSPSSSGKPLPKLSSTEMRGPTSTHSPIFYRTSNQCSGIPVCRTARCFLCSLASSGQVSSACASCCSQQTRSVLASWVLSPQWLFCGGSESEMLWLFSTCVVGESLDLCVLWGRARHWHVQSPRGQPCIGCPSMELCPCRLQPLGTNRWTKT